MKTKRLLFLVIVLLLQYVTIYAQPPGPPGYTFCAWEGQSFNLPGICHVAYGGNGFFGYLYNQTGTIRFGNALFGDPAPGVVKSGYYILADPNETPDALIQALDNILTAINNNLQINPADVKIVHEKNYLIGKNETVIQKALDCIDAYESKYGVLFINNASRNGLQNNFVNVTDKERPIFLIQQGLLDQAFTAENLVNYPSLIEGRKFASADFFPGSCPLPDDPQKVYTTKINASLPKYWGKPNQFSEESALRPTGYYLSPGSTGTVIVPNEIVNKGYKILVGAHNRDKTGSAHIQRFFRVTKSFDITNTSTQIINPLGGSVYIIVPYEANGGIVDVQLKNVVPAPFFSAKSFHKTTLAEWKDIQRKNPAPWADFESDKFMMQVPTNWINNFEDAEKLMADWDLAMDGVSELLGYPLVRNNVILYVQPDLDMMYPFYGTGFPQINQTYNPRDVENGNKNHFYLRPKDFNNGISWMVEFHELGHAQMFSHLQGYHETDIHALAIIILNEKYGLDIDLAFASSWGYNNNALLSRAQAAMNWMVAENFRKGRNMDVSNSEANEVRYQHRGFAYLAEIAALFGWDPIKNFYYQENLDHIAQKGWDGLGQKDSRILRFSKSVGVDLRPLFHFWGIQPEEPARLKQLIDEAGLPPSQLICDRLIYYKSVIPSNRDEFITHAKIFNKVETLTPASSDKYGEGWYYKWQNIYGPSQADSTRIEVQRIIDLYLDCPGSPLPMELISFEGKQYSSANILEWVTAEEENTGYYLVQRSKANSDFETIGRVDAQKNSVSNSQYSFADQNLSSSSYYYRLELHNLDGSIQHSLTIFLSRNESTIKVFPNPGNGIATIQVLGENIGRKKYSILNNLGNQVKLGEFESSEYQLLLSNLPAGVYFIKILNGSEEEIIQYIKN